MLHIIKSLVYFNDAENDEIPDMIDDVKWNDAEAYLRNAIKCLNYDFSE